MSVLVGTTAGAFLVDDETTEIVDGTRVNHLIRDNEHWWAVDGKGRVHRDGEILVTLPHGVIPLCVQPGKDVLWIGTNGAGLYTLEGSRLSRDEFFDNAPGRDTWHTPWGAPSDTRSMTLDAELTLFVNVHVGGIVRYDNTGPTPTVDIMADVHQVASHPELGGAVFAASAQGLAAARNGHDFDFRDEGLHSSYCRAVAVTGDVVLLSASTGPRSSRARVYRSSLWDGQFEPLSNGLPDWFDENVDTHCLGAFGSNLYIGHGNAVWRSDDMGSSWAVYADGLPKVTCLG